MGPHFQVNGLLTGRPEDIRRQAQRTIASYEEVLNRAREVAHDTEERLHRLLDCDGDGVAQHSTANS